MCHFNFQIGNHYLVDPTPEEECCSSSGIVVAVSGNKKITAVRKIGSGSLHPESLASMLKVKYFIYILPCNNNRHTKTTDRE